jgi:hypothetical protein
MSPRELNALLIRLGRAEIEFNRAFARDNNADSAEAIGASLRRTGLTLELINLAVERAMAGGVE